MASVWHMRETRQDQATGLRRLFARHGVATLSVAGSGGPGVTAVTLNLAAALARMGKSVLVIDRTKGEAAQTLGLPARYELAHVLDGDRPIEQVLLQGPEGVAVLPASRGLERIAEGGRWRESLVTQLGDSREAFDVWLINGLAPMQDPDAWDGDVLLVIAPTADAITSAYAQIKTLAREQGQREFRIVVNRARSESAALSTFTSVAETARRFLSARLDYIGYLPVEDNAGAAPRRNARPALADTRSARGHAFARLAEALTSALPSRLAVDHGR